MGSPPPSVRVAGSPPSIPWPPTLPTSSAPSSGPPPSNPNLLAIELCGCPSLHFGDDDLREGFEEEVEGKAAGAGGGWLAMAVGGARRSGGGEGSRGGAHSRGPAALPLSL